MSEQVRAQTRIWLSAILAIVVLTAALFWAGCRKQPAEQTGTQRHSRETTQSEPVGQSANQQIQDKPAIKNTGPAVSGKLSLNEVIRFRRSWNPIYPSWTGKMAPDFTLTDITGKRHRLSDYRGKDVLLIFWATWCRPCIIEMPHLIELRNTTDEDKLAMLAITYITKIPPNTTKMVKSLVKQRQINYTVISVDRGQVPAPYANIRGIPSSFFVDSEGKIKLATEGVISFGEIKAILQAEPL